VIHKMLENRTFFHYTKKRIYQSAVLMRVLRQDRKYFMSKEIRCSELVIAIHHNLTDWKHKIKVITRLLHKCQQGIKEREESCTPYRTIISKIRVKLKTVSVQRMVAKRVWLSAQHVNITRSVEIRSEIRRIREIIRIVKAKYIHGRIVVNDAHGREEIAQMIIEKLSQLSSTVIDKKILTLAFGKGEAFQLERHGTKIIEYLRIVIIEMKSSLKHYVHIANRAYYKWKLVVQKYKRVLKKLESYELRLRKCKSKIIPQRKKCKTIIDKRLTIMREYKKVVIFLRRIDEEKKTCVWINTKRVVHIKSVIKSLFTIQIEVIQLFVKKINHRTIEAYIISHFGQVSSMLEFFYGVEKQFSREIKVIVSRTKLIKKKLELALKMYSVINEKYVWKKKTCTRITETYHKTEKRYTTLIEERTVIEKDIKRLRQLAAHYKVLVKVDVPSIRLEIKHIDKMLRLTNTVLRESLNSRRLNFQFINKFMKMFGSMENHALKKNTRITKSVLRTTRTVLEGSITKINKLVEKTFWEIQKIITRRRRHLVVEKTVRSELTALKRSKEECSVDLETLGKRVTFKHKIVTKWRTEQTKIMEKTTHVTYLRKLIVKVKKIVVVLKSRCRVRTDCTFSTPKQCRSACHVVSGKAIGANLRLQCRTKLAGTRTCPSICSATRD